MGFPKKSPFFVSSCHAAKHALRAVSSYDAFGQSPKTVLKDCMNGKKSHNKKDHAAEHKAASNLASEQDHHSLQSAIAEMCEQHGVYLIALELRGSKERRIVEIYVDKPEGISLDECGDVSDSIGEMLESMKAFPLAYRLDVSSPGVERPLVHRWQYPRNIGRLLAVDFQNGNTIKGRLSATDGETITLEHPGKGGKSRPANHKSSSSDKKNPVTGSKGMLGAEEAQPIFPVIISFDLIRQAVVELEL